MTAAADAHTVVTRADDVPGPVQGCWTYDAYAALPADGRRYELIDGVLFVTPAPNFIHHATVTAISGYLLIHVQFTGRGIVLVAPFDVELIPGRSAVQPDVLVILNEHRAILTPTRAVGAPDLVVEVASPKTAGYDRRTKQDAYAASGVPEYWIADPYARTVEVLVLEEGAYRSLGVFAGDERLPSVVVPDLPVAVDDLFPR
jgi:Uma2 family endonuclease